MKFAVRISVFLCLLLGIPATVFTQVLPFRNYSSRDGLLSNYSLALCNDSRGYLWIGTNDGLSRYDGISFRNYTIADGLAYSRVTCLHESRKLPGTLWIGTNGGGISKLENGHFTTFRLGSTPWSNAVSSLTEDFFGNIWAATSEGVFVLQDNAFAPLSLALPRSDNIVVLPAPDSSIWIVTDHHIFSCSPRTRITHVVPIAPPGKSTFQACEVDPDRSVWLSTSGGQILRTRGETVVERIETGSSLHTFMTFGGDGSLWVGAGDALIRISNAKADFARRQVTRYTIRNGLASTYLTDGVVDREDDLWLAYGENGIARLSDFSVATHPLGPASYAPNSSTALTDQHDHVWVCTENGLMEYWNDIVQGWQSHRHDEVRKKAGGVVARSLCMDQDHTLWMALGDGTIRQYRIRGYTNSSSRLIRLKEFLPGRQFPKAVAMFLFCDDNGLLWCSMGDNRGVFLLNPQKRSPFLREYTTANGLPDMSVRAMYEDRHGNLWFGGYSDGLSLLRGDQPLTARLKLYTTQDGLPNNAIRSITEDSLGTLWVGTRYGGLAYFRDSLFHPVSLDDGLLSTAVWCMGKDPGNRLWVGTQLGMQVMIPGLPKFSTKRDWDGDPVYAVGQTSKGIVWFVSTAGLVFYDASRDRENTVPPPVHVTHFEVNGITFPTSGSFRLSSNQNNCAVEVSGVSLHEEGGLSYQYRLLGANDDKWHSPRSDRMFFFASLAPGSYTFTVRAINSSGVASTIPATLQFTILPPFWKQWWFVSGTALVVVLVAVFIVRLRVGRLLAIERLRSGIATDLHDDIGSGLTRIAILSDVAYTQITSSQHRTSSRSDETSEILGALEKVRSTARGLIDTMSDVVWAIDPSHDSFERLVQRLRSFAYELCDAKTIKLRFHNTDEVTKAKMSSEGMRNVLLLTKEALTNVAKHSHCTTAQVSMYVVDRRLVVEIIDDGKGFDPSGVRSGNGLGNMRKRTQVPGASLELKSDPGIGTHIIASFPLEG